MSRRSAWCLLAIRTCHLHSLSLVDTKQRDADRDTSRSFAKLLPRLGELRACAVPREPSSFEFYVTSRFAGAHQPHWLNRFPLYAAMKICSIIGAVEVHGPNARSKELTDQQSLECDTVGYAIASAGEEGVIELLDRLAAGFRSGNRPWGPASLLGPLYATLSRSADDQAYEPLRAIIREHLFQTMPIGKGERIFGIALTERRVHSLRSLSSKVGMGPERIRKILLGKGIIPWSAASITP